MSTVAVRSYRGFAVATTLAAACGLTLYRADVATVTLAQVAEVEQPRDTGRDTGRDAEKESAEPRARPSRSAAQIIANARAAARRRRAASAPASEGFCATNLTLGGADHPCVAVRGSELHGALSVVAVERTTPGEVAYDCDLLVEALANVRDWSITVSTRHSPLRIIAGAFSSAEPALRVEHRVGPLLAGHRRQLRFRLTEQEADRGQDEQVELTLAWKGRSPSSALVVLPLPREDPPGPTPRNHPLPFGGR